MSNPKEVSAEVKGERRREAQRRRGLPRPSFVGPYLQELGTIPPLVREQSLHGE
ncbi:MAG: hypothetical protein ACRC62_39340 [Microcoleus sp.]